MTPKSPFANGPGAVDLIEEGMHLLRSAPAEVLLVYYAGTAPFALGVLFFWAYTTWFSPDGAELMWMALGLVGLFAAMKGAHAVFCARVLALRLGGEIPPWSWRELFQSAVAQLRWQAWGLAALPIALLLAVPFGWTYAYFENLSVISGREEAPATAREQAARWPAQNHRGLLILAVLGLYAWVNLAAAFQMVPWVASHVLGIENVFGLRGVAFFNTTVLASVTMVAWLAVDPLIKVFYTLRVFHGRALRTGEDLRVTLRAERRPANRRLVGAAWIALAIALGVPRARAADVPPPQAPVKVVELDRAIDRTLAGSDFQWKLRPRPPPVDPSQDGPIYRFIRTGVEWIGDLVRSVFRAVGRFYDWLESMLSPKGSAPAAGAAGGYSGISIAMIILLSALAALLLFVAFVVWKRTRAKTPAAMLANVIVPAVPDLRSEATEAALLPTDGWLALAREQMKLGEWRLAWRALYLATLAQLSEAGLVSLARFKTNLDYEHEVRRRALARDEIPQRFAMRRRGFEAAWYGREQPAEAEVRAWLAELEKPARP